MFNNSMPRLLLTDDFTLSAKTSNKTIVDSHCATAGYTSVSLLSSAATGLRRGTLANYQAKMRERSNSRTYSLKVAQLYKLSNQYPDVHQFSYMSYEKRLSNHVIT